MYNSEDPKHKKYWNGEITLATSMCEEEFENGQVF